MPAVEPVKPTAPVTPSKHFLHDFMSPEEANAHEQKLTNLFHQGKFKEAHDHLTSLESHVTNHKKHTEIGTAAIAAPVASIATDKAPSEAQGTVPNAQPPTNTSNAQRFIAFRRANAQKHAQHVESNAAPQETAMQSAFQTAKPPQAKPVRITTVNAQPVQQQKAPMPEDASGIDVRALPNPKQRAQLDQIQAEKDAAETAISEPTPKKPDGRKNKQQAQLTAIKPKTNPELAAKINAGIAERKRKYEEEQRNTTAGTPPPENVVPSAEPTNAKTPNSKPNKKTNTPAGQAETKGDEFTDEDLALFQKDLNNTHEYISKNPHNHTHTKLITNIKSKYRRLNNWLAKLPKTPEFDAEREKLEEAKRAAGEDITSIELVSHMQENVAKANTNKTPTVSLESPPHETQAKTTHSN
jgi:ribosomal protein S15P/S13E